jgi:hypothetical protein
VLLIFVVALLLLFASFFVADAYTHHTTTPHTTHHKTAIESRIHAPQEECARGPACWLWDYLRRR